MSQSEITLYQFSGEMGVPNPSPFCMKLEGVLKLSNIPYETKVQNDPRTAPKKKLPYIVHNNQKIADSNLVIEYLKSNLNVDLDAHLSEEEKAIHHAMRVMLDEHLYFVMMFNRWQEDANWAMLRDRLFGAIPKFIRGVITNKIRSGILTTLDLQGMGRHTREEVYEMGAQDIQALATYLGDKHWFGGDKPCMLDVCAVSYLANFMIPPIDSPLKHLIKQDQKLAAYVQRGMKAIFDC